MSKIRPARYLILEEKPNPSTDYFVLAHLRALDGDDQTYERASESAGEPKKILANSSTNSSTYSSTSSATSTSTSNSAHPPPDNRTPVHRFSWGQPIEAALFDGACVILVRYVTPELKKLIDTHRHKLRELVYFFDDDIPDTVASEGLAKQYRDKLYRYGAKYFGWLVKTNATLWVSTPYLQDKYRDHQPVLLYPQQLPTPANRCRVFYHATASHADEIAWLLPVIREVLQQAPHVDFEIVGDVTTLGLYRKLPRTTVVYPMSWQAYQHFVAWPGRHIGLAPFLPSAFNAARSYTKLFDIERSGARGILADTGPWAKLPQAQAHTLLPMEPERWVEEIVALSRAVIESGPQAALAKPQQPEQPNE